jgi:hypothetical protein
MVEKRVKDPITKKILPRTEPKPMTDATKKALAFREKARERRRWVRQQQGF